MAKKGGLLGLLGPKEAARVADDYDEEEDEGGGLRAELQALLDDDELDDDDLKEAVKDLCG